MIKLVLALSLLGGALGFQQTAEMKDTKHYDRPCVDRYIVLGEQYDMTFAWLSLKIRAYC